MRKMILLFASIAFLTACSTTQTKLDPNYQAYLQAVQNYHPKLVEIDAQPGKTIQMVGVSKFVVYAPSGSSRNLAVYRQPENPGVAITHDVLHTIVGGALQILPGYFGWRYGSGVLKKAFDSAGQHYNVQGNYNSGTYTTVGGDLTGGDKYAVQGNYNTGTYAGGDYTQGDHVGGDKNTVTGDYVTGTKTDTTVTGDYVTGTKTDYTDSYNKTNGDIDNGTVSE